MRFLLPLLCCLPLLHAEQRQVGAIAVVDLQALFKGARVFSTRIDRLKGDKEDAERTLRAMRDDAEKLRNNLRLLKPDDKRYAESEEALEVLRVREKIFRERTNQALDRAHARIMAETYGTIRSALADFAKDRGIKLIYSLPVPVGESSIQEVQINLGMQAVLYADPSLEVTGDFLQFLNARFPGEAAPAPQGQGASEGQTQPGAGPGPANGGAK